MALPAAVEYGQVRWRAVSAAADGGDADEQPDAVPVTGTVTFEPSAKVLLATAGPAPITVFATAVEYTLDSDGVLRDSSGRDLLTLVATDSDGLTPTGWTWTCSYKLNGGLVRGSFAFQLPAGTVVDLTAVAPVGTSGGAQIVQGPAGLGVPSGGSTGQVLAKASEDDFDTEWITPPSDGGGGGSGALVHQQSSPTASWSITHAFGRLPGVDVYVAGQLVEADVEATTSTVTVTFPSPTAGTAVLV